MASAPAPIANINNPNAIVSAGVGYNPGEISPLNAGSFVSNSQPSTPKTSAPSINAGSASNLNTSSNTSDNTASASTTPSSTTTAATPSPLQGNFNDALNQVIGYYNTVLGTEPNAVGSAEALANQGYGSQIGTLNNSYAQAQSQVPWQLVGRGAGDSSWADNANTYANNAYNNSMTGIQSAESQDIDQLQKQLDTDQGEANYFINQEAPQLRSIFPNLDSYYQNAQVGQLLSQAQNLAGQTGGNLPVNVLAQQIAANPIYSQQGSNQISGLEAQLASSGAPTAIQNQILGAVNANNPVLPNILTNLQAPNPVSGPAGS